MGYSLQVDLKDAEPVASNSGWGDFIRWVEDLPVEPFFDLHHLCEWGWTGKVPALREQLQAAWKEFPSEQPGLEDTVEGAVEILTAAGNAEVVTVTDGLGPSRGDGPEEDEDEDEEDADE